jgi:hypothetical protein
LRGLEHLPVIGLGVLSGLQSVLVRMRWIVGEGQPFGDEVIVDLAIGRGVPERDVLHGCGVLARCVLAQQVTDFMNQYRRVLFNGVCREPGVVVIEPPARINGHAGDHVRPHWNQIEQGRSEIGPLI